MIDCTGVGGVRTGDIGKSVVEWEPLSGMPEDKADRAVVGAGDVASTAVNGLL